MCALIDELVERRKNNPEGSNSIPDKGCEKNKVCEFVFFKKQKIK